MTSKNDSLTDPLEIYESLKQAVSSVLAPSLDVSLAIKGLGNSTTASEMIQSSRKVQCEAIKLASLALGVAARAEAFERKISNLVGEDYVKQKISSPN